LFFAGSCTSHQGHPPTSARETGRIGANARTPGEQLIERRIIEEYQRWKGARHKMGGTGRKGLDCSGFVKVVYWNAFDIELPRTTKAQVKRGKPVRINDLQSGDLVFFRPPQYGRHVGIYLSQSKFVHASKKKGVTVSRIDPSYWERYYWTARRILPDN